MNTTVIKPQQSSAKTHDELILVIKRSLLFSQHSWQGLYANSMQEYIDLIQQHQEFLPRSLMEQDPDYKQIIPYIIFRHDGSYFVMQRKSTTTEQRLKNKYTIGIGGHMRQEDMLNGASLFDWARREFYEEVAYSSPFTFTPLGIINDDSTEVGKVHLGLVLLVEGSSDQIKVKSELKSGQLMTPQLITSSYYEHMETWSQIAFSFINSL